MSKVLVVGSCNLDLVIKLPRLPRPGETVTGGEYSVHLGGKGANQAAAAKLAGAEVEFIGKIGKDSQGTTPVDGLKKLGVGLKGLVQDPEAASGTAFIMVGEGGENLIGVAPGANTRLLPTDMPALPEIMKRVQALLVQLEIPMETVIHVLKLARQAKTTTILDPAPVRALGSDIYPLVDIITPNQAEAAALTKMPITDIASAQNAASEILGWGTSAVIITMGAGGALVVSHDLSLHINAVEVEAVDSTAAGDAFNGALAAALARGRPLHEAALYANCAAALSVTRPGAQSSLPAKEEIDKLWKSQLRD